MQDRVVVGLRVCLQGAVAVSSHYEIQSVTRDRLQVYSQSWKFSVDQLRVLTTELTTD
jgi:hypothetical protein